MNKEIETIAAPLTPIESGGRLPDQGEGVKTIAELVRAASEVSIHTVSIPAGVAEGAPAAIPVLIDRRSGGRVSDMRDIIEKYRTRPERRRGSARGDTLSSFIDLTNRHKTGESVIFAKASWPQPRLTTVIDYHHKDGRADNLSHRIEYPFPITEEFKAWLDGNGQPMEQAEFAQFMEDHAAELTAPYDQEKSDYERLFKCIFATPNELIDLARHLEVYSAAKVKQGQRLQTGESILEFSEEHHNGKGEPVTIPGVFMVAIPAFIGGNPVRIPARLRYRLRGGINWTYHLYRPAEWLREQVQADMATAAEKTGLPAYEGAPEGSA